MVSETAGNYPCKIYKGSDGTIYCVVKEDTRLFPVTKESTGEKYEFDSTSGRLVHTIDATKTESGTVTKVDFNNEDWIELDFTIGPTYDETGLQTTDYITNIGKRFTNSVNSKYRYKLYGETAFVKSDERGPYVFDLDSNRHVIDAYPRTSSYYEAFLAYINGQWMFCISLQ